MNRPHKQGSKLGDLNFPIYGQLYTGRDIRPCVIGGRLFARRMGERAIFVNGYLLKWHRLGYCWEEALA